MDHPLYPKATLQTADAVAWVAMDPKEGLFQYPFTFFPVDSNQVRLKVLHTSICQSDIHTMRGYWGPCNYPLCPGHEVIGQITIVGEQVKTLKIGDIVGVSPIRHSCGKCKFCERGQTNLCPDRTFLYGEYFGGYATHMQVQHNWVFKIPEGMKLEAIAPLLCAGVTVFAPIQRYFKAGAKVAVLGIGGLGHLAIQYSAKMGMHVTAFTTKTNNIVPLKNLGAQGIEHSTNPQLLQKQEGKFDLVLSTLFITDHKLYKLHQRLTAPGGTYVMIGNPDATTQYEIDTEYVLNHDIRIAGSIVGSIDAVNSMLKFSAEHNVVPINEYFEFQDFNEALKHSEKGNPHFRSVVNVERWAKANGFDK